MDERGIEDAIVMDENTFKSLTSETRTEILKLLKKRNHTLSEIAKALKISKTTAKEHLDILVEGRLVEQVPSTNIWKYYTLTKDGKKLVGEEGPKRVVILIAMCIFGILLSFYGAYGLTAPDLEKQTGATHFYTERGGEESIAQVQAMQTDGMQTDEIPAQEGESVAESVAKIDNNNISVVALVLGLSIIMVSLFTLLKRNKERSIV
ncbi:MAG: winged helix-turn-helix domain-containing protein [Candidatus Bilamarchaeaceae archaeon]